MVGPSLAIWANRVCKQVSILVWAAHFKPEETRPRADASLHTTAGGAAHLPGAAALPRAHGVEHALLRRADRAAALGLQCGGAVQCMLKGYPATPFSAKMVIEPAPRLRPGCQPPSASLSTASTTATLKPLPPSPRPRCAPLSLCPRAHCASRAIAVCQSVSSPPPSRSYGRVPVAFFLLLFSGVGCAPIAWQSILFHALSLSSRSRP